MSIIGLASVSSTVTVALLSFTFDYKQPYFKWIQLYCLLNGFLELVSYLLAEYYLNNIWCFYVSIFIELFFVLNFFRVISPRLHRSLNHWTFITIYTILVVALFISKDHSYLNPNPSIVEGITIFLCCLMFFSEELKSLKYTHIIKEPVFWFVGAFFTYYGSSWLLLFSTNYLLNSKSFLNIWDVQNLFNLVKYIIIVVGFICLKQAQKVL